MKVNFGENISNNFRIGLGNTEVKEVEIESIEVSYGEKAININSIELSNYFKFNEFISQDVNSNILQTKQINGKHTPMIYLKAEFLKE